MIPPKDCATPNPVDVARQLADGFSAQAKHSNKVWLALIVASTLAIFPDVGADGMVKLPFSLGSVDVVTYRVVGYLILTILMIAYCQTFGATHVASRFIHAQIAKFESENERVQARKILDLHVTPNLVRVAPLAQLLSNPKLAASYYFLLKLVAVTVVFGIPTAALFATFGHISSMDVGAWVYFLSSVALCITVLSILQMLILEIGHTIKVFKHFWTAS